MITDKIRELEREFERGQEQLAYLDQKRAELRDTMLRISGAIQVLRELQGSGNSTAQAPGVTVAPAVQVGEAQP